MSQVSASVDQYMVKAGAAVGGKGRDCIEGQVDRISFRNAAHIDDARTLFDDCVFFDAKPRAISCAIPMGEGRLERLIPKRG
jgi:hypothetical protein